MRDLLKQDSRNLVKKKKAALEEAVSIVKQVYSELPCYDKLIPALLEQGVHGLADHCSLTPGIVTY